MKTPILLLCLLSTAPLHAGIYKCMVDGQPVFSQRPCGDDAQEVEVRYQPVAPVSAGKTAPAYRADRDMDRYVEQRRIKRELERAKSKRKQLVRARDEDLRFWHREAGRWNATASTAGYSMSRAGEVRSMYNEKIAVRDREIAALEKRLRDVDRRR